MVNAKGASAIIVCMAAIPLSMVLLAIALNKRSKFRPGPKLSEQEKASPVVGTLTNMDTHQVNEKQSQWQEPQQEPSPQQRAKTQAMMGSTPSSLTANTTATTSTKSTDTYAPSSCPVGHSSVSSDNPVAVSRKSLEQEEVSVSDDVKKAGGSLKGLIITAVKEAKDSAKETGKRTKGQTINITYGTDSKDVRFIGDNRDSILDLFEKTMVEIRKEGYDSQIKLLDSYKELLHAQIKLINARSRMARRLKPGA
ncbi:MAG: hypothetical protein M3258_05150 [Thermoproteota archaeon]|nr:hypothetical protein [Thermoproteota archaeon]